MITVYGIPNCDTVKKARTWLDQRGIAYTFHDYKKLGADPAKLAAWVEAAGWEKVLNRAGTTFKKLPEADRDGLDAAKAVAVMAPIPAASSGRWRNIPAGCWWGSRWRNGRRRWGRG